MLAILNNTPFAVQLAPALDLQRRDVAIVVVKATFRVSHDGATTVAEAQEPVALADVHEGDPSHSSVRYESDLAPYKPGTDVVLNGHAYPQTPRSELIVTVEAGPLSKSVRVVGDRTWTRDPTGHYRPSSPARFEAMPLVYERAFGGVDRSIPPPDASSTSPSDPRNPVGVGFLAEATRASPQDLELPNLEDPQAPMTSPTDRPTPASFGFVHRSWSPRARLAGTYDATWQAERAPYLPDDFDVRFHHAASPGLVSPQPFRGGELVRAYNTRPGGGMFQFYIPRHVVEADVRLHGKDAAYVAQLDTVVIEPDLERVLCTWRAVVPCPRSFLKIERVRVKLRESN
ncbi:MAG: DUF2169 domain-containing protein [Polyangiaceae bacterium]